MKIRNLILGASLLSSVVAHAEAKTSILIVPQDGNVAAVIESLRQNGFQVDNLSACSNSHDSVKIERIGQTKEVRVSCVTAQSISATKVVPFGQGAQGTPNAFEGNATGTPNVFEGNATGTPNVFEGNATGTPNVFEGNATGTPNVFEGNATGTPNAFEGNATGTPNVFEGNATGAAASKPSLSARIETAARAIHAKIYKLIME